MKKKKKNSKDLYGDLPGGPEVKTISFQFRGCGFSIPSWGPKTLQAPSVAKIQKTKQTNIIYSSYTVCQRLKNRNSRKRQQRKQRKGNYKQRNTRKLPRTECVYCLKISPKCPE